AEGGGGTTPPRTSAESPVPASYFRKGWWGGGLYSHRLPFRLARGLASGRASSSSPPLAALNHLPLSPSSVSGLRASFPQPCLGDRDEPTAGRRLGLVADASQRVEKQG